MFQLVQRFTNFWRYIAKFPTNEILGNIANRKIENLFAVDFIKVVFITDHSDSWNMKT